MPRCSAVILGTALGSVFLPGHCQDDVQAMVQQMAEVQQSAMRSQDWKDWFVDGICTKADMEAFQKKMDSYTERQKQNGQRKLTKVQKDQLRMQKASEKANEKVYAKVKAHSEWTETAFNETLDILKQKYQPLILKLAKGLFQLVDDAPAHWTPINVTETALSFAADTNLLQKDLLAVLQKGLQSFDASLNSAIGTLPHQVRSLKKLHLELPSFEQNITHWGEYMLMKMAPIMTMEMYPEMAKVVKILELMPSTDDKKALTSYLVNQVLSAALTVMFTPTPPPKPVMNTAAMPQQVTKESVAVQGLIDSMMAPPVLHCITCQQRYDDLTQNPHNANSCASKCVMAFPTCLGGLSDFCIKSWAPCLRCHKNRLKQLGECQEVDSWDKGVEKLDKLFTIFNAGSDGLVEKLNALVLA